MDSRTDVSRTLELGKHRHGPLCSHEEHTEHLAHARKTTRIDLTDVYRLRLEQLLEQYPVVCVLARRDADSVSPERAPDRGMPKDVIRRRGLLNEPKK